MHPAAVTAERVAARALADFTAAVRAGDEESAAVNERALLVVIGRLVGELRDLYLLLDRHSAVLN